MTGWHNLPAEIRWMIFDYIKEFAHIWSSNEPPYPQLPRVNREWNHHFAHANFGVLVLDQDRLDDFDKFVSQNQSRRKYVQRIFLWVKLLEYDCDVCQTPEDAETAHKNTEIFVKTVHRFFNIISTWRRPQPGHGKGISLEVGAYSPSDGQHGFRDCQLFKKFPHLATREMHNLAPPDGQVTASDDADSCPEWLRARDGKAPLMGSKRRLLATLGPPAAPLPRPRAATKFAACPIFDSLSIQHHCYRHISPLLVQSIMKALTRVNLFRGDTWVHPDDNTRSEYHENLALIFNDMPKSLRHVILSYETRAPFRPRKAWSSDFLSCRFALAGSVADCATSLRSLSVSFQIDALDFIEQSLDMDMPFDRLKSLELTSTFLRDHASRMEIIGLLALAGRLVFSLMPKLKMLHIWNKANTKLFHCYISCTKKGDYKVKWQSTWIHKIDLRMLKVAMRLELNAHFPHKKLRFSRLL